MYTVPTAIAQEGCDRMIIGQGKFDCFQGDNNATVDGLRCINGGKSCRNRAYPQLTNVVVWVLKRSEDRSNATASATPTPSTSSNSSATPTPSPVTGSQITITTSAGAFKAFAQSDALGRTWIKAIQFPLKYVPNRSAIGDVSTSSIAGVAKLSDEQINSIKSSTGIRVYRIDVASSWKETWWSGGYMFVSTDKGHNDTQPSFGVTGGATRVKVGNATTDVSTTSSGWSTFTSNWWDNANTSPKIVDSTYCARFLIGGGTFDCSGESDVRCINGGTNCAGLSSPKLTNVVVWVLFP